MAKTKIEWADTVWNPVTGCSKVSEGCRNCYAETMAKRFWGDRKFTDVQCHEDKLDEIRHWRKPRRIFLCSMSDLFHQDVPFEFVDKVLKTWSYGNRRHTLMILTKRPERMYEYFQRDLSSVFWDFNEDCGPYPHVRLWLGVSVEDQHTADERIPILLQTPAAIRFVSCEPLLEKIDLERVSLPDAYLTMNGITGCLQPLLEKNTEPDDYRYFTRKSMKLDWVIVGGESGKNARPMHPDWVRSIRDQCQEADVPFFFKQWGEWKEVRTTDQETVERYSKDVLSYTNGDLFFKIGKKHAGRLLDGREWNEYPHRNRDE